MSTADSNSIQFVQPEKADIDSFAYQVCRDLTESLGEDFADAEVVQGFSELLQVVVQIGAQFLSDTVNNPLDTQLQELQEAVAKREDSDEETVSYDGN